VLELLANYIPYTNMAAVKVTADALDATKATAGILKIENVSFQTTRFDTQG